MVGPASPRITSIGIFRGNRQLSPLQVKGDVDVIVEAYDIPPLAVPLPWANCRSRRRRSLARPARRRVVRRWHTPVDFRKSLIERELFPAVYAPGTRQNKPGKPGLYRFYIARGWTTSLLRNGLYRLQVEASDQTGNKATAALPFTIAN